jgi:hypothetical protein
MGLICVVLRLKTIKSIMTLNGSVHKAVKQRYDILKWKKSGDQNFSGIKVTLNPNIKMKMKNPCHWNSASATSLENVTFDVLIWARIHNVKNYTNLIL